MTRLIPLAALLLASAAPPPDPPAEAVIPHAVARPQAPSCLSADGSTSGCPTYPMISLGHHAVSVTCSSGLIIGVWGWPAFDPCGVTNSPMSHDGK
jgi:hypothetical protein